MAKPSPVKIPTTTLDDYAHSPFHYAVVSGDHPGLLRLVSSLPKLTEPEQIHTESDSISQDRVAEIISAVIDRRDVPFQETPLHLAVRLGDLLAVKTISSAGADVTLKNVAGWNALNEAVSRGNAEITEIILRDQRRSGWCKWRRRLPYMIAVLGRMRDFYFEVSIDFESSVIPFFEMMAPSDTYKIWKRGSDLRVDTSLTGFDRFKIRRANQRFLFLSEEDESPGTLLVLNRDDKTIANANAFEKAGDSGSVSEMDVTKAELVVLKNWRGKEKVETVGEWKAKGYEVKNVSFSSKTEKKNSLSDKENGRSFSKPLLRQLSCSNVEVKEVQKSLRRRRKSVSLPAASVPVTASWPVIKEKETVKSLSPTVWLTNDFPLNTEELLPVLDILAIDVEAIRRMKELLTVKFPVGSFPVKLSIPVIPTVKVVMTFSKFVALPAMDEFYTPLSSPRHISAGIEDQCDVESDKRTSTSRPLFTTKPSWLRLKATKKRSYRRLKKEQAQMVDPFAIPAGYTWTSKSN
ncbi:unnamed protein product [Eruca vesicaria subsp. sativa]|uniref:Ankyrin repeat domain-containing protein n=1 Tax=Eruca vesicaria subsp. sativa TaxID=29727 RepID=A0ABC8LYV0_ERUVS|nr:unnamed protein product [Eruca vesicaria subsp. sativa]